VQVGIETDRGPWVAALIAAGYTVFAVNPLQMRHGPPRDEQHARRWSRWRHRHQERARRSHYQRQRLQDH